MRAANSLSLELTNSHLEAPLRNLRRALDLESLWQASRVLVDRLLPHHSCSLMLDITGDRPRTARHHVAQTLRPDYVPATTLTVARPFLESHRRVKCYTYSQIVSEDPAAANRRIAQEPGPVEWTEFVHLAFWREREPQAVLSIRRTPAQPAFSRQELQLLRQIHPLIDAGVDRIWQFESDHAKNRAYEQFLRTLRLPVMLLDTDGGALFATREAREMCARWNQSRRAHGRLDAHEVDRPPKEITDSLQGAGNTALPAPNHWQVRHPVLTGFVAKIEVSSAAPRPCYMVTFTYATGAAARAQRRSPAALLALRQLTPSECNVALLVTEGLRNSEIADRLCRSLRTIEFQLNAIYRKLDVSCRTQLIKLLL